MAIYVVKSNDTVDSIALSYEISRDRIIYDNQLIFPFQLAIGQSLFIADDNAAPVKSIRVNGYAYPFISTWVLEETLPFLNELSVFSYGFTPQGNLIPPVLDTSMMLEKARSFGVDPILTLTPLGSDGRFNNVLIHQLVSNQEAQNTLIQELLKTMQDSGYKGVNIDFEYILPEDRDLYTSFVKNVTQQLNNASYRVSVALAPKTSDEQTGVLYEGKDYGGLGAAANSVLLMTYEWGFT